MEEIFYSAWIWYSTSDHPETTIDITEWKIYKETLKWYWVTPHIEYTNDMNYKKYCKWIPNTEREFWSSKKIKATKQQAVVSLHNRLIKRISWYKYWMKQCENWIEIIKENKWKIPENKPYTMTLE